MVLKKRYVFWSKMVPRTIPNWRQRRCETLLLGLYAGLMCTVYIYIYILYLYYIYNINISLYHTVFIYYIIIYM